MFDKKNKIKYELQDEFKNIFNIDTKNYNDIIGDNFYSSLFSHGIVRNSDNKETLFWNGFDHYGYYPWEKNFKIEESGYIKIRQIGFSDIKYILKNIEREFYEENASEFAMIRYPINNKHLSWIISLVNDWSKTIFR